MRRKSVLISFALGVLLVSVASAAGKGSLQVTLNRPMVVAGTPLGPGSCMIAWTSHSPETDLKFAMHGKVVAEAHGKMVERPEKAVQDTLVTVRDDSGREVLKEIRFEGKKSVLVLD